MDKTTGYRRFRLREVPVLRALQQFGVLYQQAVQHRIAQTHDQLKRAVELAVAKGKENQTVDDDVFEKAVAVGSQMKRKFDAHMREIGKG